MACPADDPFRGRLRPSFKYLDRSTMFRYLDPMASGSCFKVLVSMLKLSPEVKICASSVVLPCVKLHINCIHIP